MRSNKINLPGLTWPLIVGILIMVGCDRGTSVGPGNGDGDAPQNSVYFTMEGEDADALLTINQNEANRVYDTVGPPWPKESPIIPARRNDEFYVQICNSTGARFQIQMFLNGNDIQNHFHDTDSECSEFTVTLDETYDGSLLD